MGEFWACSKHLATNSNPCHVQCRERATINYWCGRTSESQNSESLLYIFTAQFTVQPVSVERAEGLEAVFRGQYQAEGFDVSYDWFINNSFVGADTDTVRARPPSSRGGSTTMIIVATPQHNNSIVYCEAIIRNGSYRTFVISSPASFFLWYYGCGWVVMVAFWSAWNAFLSKQCEKG